MEDCHPLARGAGWWQGSGVGMRVGMFWVIVAAVVAVLVALAWWSSGRARPNTRPNVHGGVRDHQARGDEQMM